MTVMVLVLVMVMVMVLVVFGGVWWCLVFLLAAM